MKCKTCTNTHEDIEFFISLDDNNKDYICGDCVDTMHGHYQKYCGNDALKSKVSRPSKKKIEMEIPSSKKLVEYLDQYIIGQECAKKDIAVAVRNHYKRLSLSDEVREDVEKSNILMMGESGTGKTKIIQQIAKFINVPMSVVDCTSMSASGYTGDDVDKCIKDLYEQAGKNKTLTEYGIVFLDELDKKKKSTDNRTADVGGADVQKSLLRTLEGKKVKVQKGVEIDTTNILFIAGGAFVGLDKIVETRMGTNNIGFGRSTLSETSDMGNIYENVTTDDLVQFGLIPELIGRLPVHTYTRTLSKDDIKRVITDTKNSVVKQFETLFAVDGVKLSFKADAIDYVAERAIIDKIGVRGLRKVLENELRNIQYDIEDYKSRNIRTVVVNVDRNKNKLKTTFRYYPKVKKNTKKSHNNK